MQTVFTNCAGLDVHKTFLVACCLSVNAQGQPHKEIRTFGTMTDELEDLADWLAALGCTQVVIESTGVYWQPIYNILEERVEVWLVNPQHIKHVPGRKTDVQDAEWLAQLMQHGLLKASFIPPREQRDLRDLVRQRQTLVEERNRITNRLQKVLEDTNLKLASVASDLQGVTAQAILHALLAGEEDPHKLAGLARGRLRTKRAELERSLKGTLREHHRFLLTRVVGPSGLSG
jgi:transposase